MKLGPIHMIRDSSVQQLVAELRGARSEFQAALSRTEQMEATIADLRTRVEAPAPPRSQESTPEAAPPASTPGTGLLLPILRDSSDAFVEPPTPPPSNRAMFDTMETWVTAFTIDGEIVGGPSNQCTDPHLTWFMEIIGGVRGKRILELGPMEGAHSKTLIEHGASEIVAIEGFRSNWLKCLIIKEIFGLHAVRFLYGDFCRYVATYAGPPFDCVLGSGVFYHQMNAPQLIRDLARITDQVLVFGVVADETSPVGGVETTVSAGGQIYRGKINNYQGARNRFKNFLGGPDETAVWLYPDELRRAFRDAGFESLVERPEPDTQHGPALLFVASKPPEGRGERTQYQQSTTQEH